MILMFSEAMKYIINIIINFSEIADDDKTIFDTSEPEPSDLTSVGYKRG